MPAGTWLGSADLDNTETLSAGVLDGGQDLFHRDNIRQELQRLRHPESLKISKDAIITFHLRSNIFKQTEYKKKKKIKVYEWGTPKTY